MIAHCLHEIVDYYGVPEWSLVRQIVQKPSYKSQHHIGALELQDSLLQKLVGKKWQKVGEDVCASASVAAYEADKTAGVKVKLKIIGLSHDGQKKPQKHANSNIKIHWKQVSRILSLPSYPKVTNNCINAAVTYYHLPYKIFVGILKTESGQVGHISPDANGSFDIGPAQVNSIHLPFFARHGITYGQLLNNGCVNIFAGAYILSRSLNTQMHIKNAHSLWVRVGYYNSATPYYNKRYRRLVRENIENLFGKS